MEDTRIAEEFFDAKMVPLLRSIGVTSPQRMAEHRVQFIVSVAAAYDEQVRRDAEAETTADTVQVIMVPALFKSFKAWLAEHGYQVFRIPGLSKKELPTYGVTPHGSFLGEVPERD